MKMDLKIEKLIENSNKINMMAAIGVIRKHIPI